MNRIILDRNQRKNSRKHSKEPSPCIFGFWFFIELRKYGNSSHKINERIRKKNNKSNLYFIKFKFSSNMRKMRKDGPDNE